MASADITAGGGKVGSADITAEVAKAGSADVTATPEGGKGESALLEAVSAVLEVGTSEVGRAGSAVRIGRVGRAGRVGVRVATSTKATEEASYRVTRAAMLTRVARGRDCATYISD